jgi:tetratricopeptide (TPR) repeat protein
MAMNRIATAALFLCACAAQENKRLVVPDGMRRQAQPLPRPENKPATASLQGALQPAATQTKTGDGRYLLRLAEHNRLWELELPESAGGYEMRIPLDGPLDAPTAADSELLASAREADGANDRPAVDAGTKTKAKNVEATTASISRAGAPTANPAVAVSAAAPPEPIATPRRKSYLGTLAKVREMYASRKYELALVELVDLEPSYPNDGRVQAMKGSLYLKLGKPQLARESWQKALALDPDDAAVAEALRNLKEE